MQKNYDQELADQILHLSARAAAIRPFMVMEILECAQALEAAGMDVIHLEIGEPDLPTPKKIVESAQQALIEGRTTYTHSQGSIELRTAISEHYLAKYGVAVDPDQIVVTSGTSAAMMLAFGMLLDSGDEAVMTDPYYSCYPNFVRFLGGTCRYVDTDAQNGFELAANRLKDMLTQKTKVLILNSPANPTGSVMSAGLMQEIVDTLPENVFVISDEIYHGLSYGGKDRSMLEFTDKCIVLNGFSKAYAMTGWRLGYMIVPRAMVRAAQSLQQNFYISANNFVQAAAVTALTECSSEQEEMRSTFEKRRNFLLSALPQTGLRIHHEPLGAFYMLADAREMCKRFNGSSYELALHILEKTGVALTPGSDFGSRSEGFLRLSYASSIPKLTEAISRLTELFLSERI